MASRIRVLCEHTINKIAAGEVIENPASVVKELVENSLDAEAHAICIEIKSGGRQMIRISDDGCGMTPDDAVLCLERHATSKIREVEELQELSTMGFRGEALPSIASISKFTLITCPTPNDSLGTMVSVEGGKILNVAPAARSQGTTIEVQSLFFNVPVRKKFLKSPASDSQEILKTVSLMALGFPEIKFQLISDGRQILSTYPSEQASFELQLKARIESVLGSDFAQNGRFIQADNGLMEIRGFVGTPFYTRQNRTGQYLFINRRAVVSPLVSFAIKDAFGTALPTGRYPVFVLHLTLPGNLVDVNVHPQKREVRLRQEQAIKMLIHQAVESTLHRPDREESFSLPAAPVPPVFSPTFQTPPPPSMKGDAWVFTPRPAAAAMPKVVVPPPISIPLEEKIIPRILGTLPHYILIDGTVSTELTQGKGGLVLVDQKAAHARVIYEKLLQADEGKPIAQQSLLIPHVIHLPPHEAETLKECLGEIHKFGIQIEEFGPNCFHIDAIPQIFGNSDVHALIADLLHEFRDRQTILQERIKKLSLAASRAAIAGTRVLTVGEAQALIRQLMACQNPRQSPAGKPILAYLSPEDLAKIFQKF